MRNNCVFAALCITLFLISCQKEDLTTAVSNTTTSAANSSDARWKLSRFSQPASQITTVYGSLIDPPNSEQNWLNFQLDVAGKLGISSIRANTMVPATWSVTNILNTSYKIILNFNSSVNVVNSPKPYVRDLAKYRIDLNNILNTYTTLPAIAVIENEEPNRLYFSGTTQEYLNELQTAIDVMHNRGIKVANGGLCGPGVDLLVYQDFLNQGKVDSANKFAALTHLDYKAPTIQAAAAFMDTLLQSYARMPLDYVNFHWTVESPNADAFKQVVAFLKKKSGKPVINNEVRQFDNDPNSVIAVLCAAKDVEMPYLLWYSPNENAFVKPASLHHPDGSLTSRGIAYQNYLKN